MTTTFDKISLSKLLNTIFSPTPKEKLTVLPDEKNAPITLRLEPDIKKYCEFNAQRSGLTTQAFISLVLKGVMSASSDEQKSQLFLMKERFLEIFKAHKIPLADIPNLFNDFSFPLSSLTSDQGIIDILTPGYIDKICTLFVLNEKWLKGVNDNCCIGFRWYKNVFQICKKIIENKADLLIVKKKGEGFINTNNTGDDEDERYVIPILKYSKNINDKKIEVFELCEPNDVAYWRGALHMLTIILFCDIHNVGFVHGYELGEDEFRNLAMGATMPTEIYNKYRSSWRPYKYISIKKQENTNQRLLAAIKYFTDINLKDLGKDIPDEYIEYLNIKEEETEV